MIILICNAGSTSLKFKLWDMPGERVLCAGRVERVGTDEAIFGYDCAEKSVKIEEGDLSIRDYTAGISRFLSCMTDREVGAVKALDQVDAVGFKTVLCKGVSGTRVIDAQVISGMEAYYPVAPAHNGPYLEAIRVFQKLLADKPLVGAFETAFHETIPRYRRLYGVPYEWIERYGIMKMGFHGASHSYIAEKMLGVRRVISCHLGGSSSLCAILDGKSVDNTLGFSMQTGLMHNNRVGDLDAYVILYLMKMGVAPEEIDRQLTEQAGLKGISGTSGDMRDVIRAMAQGSERAQLAFDMLADAIRRYIGAYTVEMGGLDAIVFTGGIGENCWQLRAKVLEGLGCLGVEMDAAKNQGARGEAIISKEGAKVLVRVIPANEELMVVRRTCECLKQRTQ
ncbi:MAG: acetate/propionate family kinase [Clostridia bacterium]